MREKETSGFNSTQPTMDSEHLRRLDALRKKLGKPDFPVACPTKLMEVPDGYRRWREMYKLHQLLISAKQSL